jgi:hypothetical protein
MFKYLLNYLVENKVTLELLNDKQIIKNIMTNIKEYKIKDDSFVFEPGSGKNTFKATFTLNNFLLKYNNIIS